MTKPAQIIRNLKKPNRAWIRPLQEGAGARYQQIIQQITEAVQDGVLRPGDRLPPQRDIAQTMGVDLTTVTRAYNEVRQQGLLESHGAGGSYIAAKGLVGDQTIDLSMNVPPLLQPAVFARLLESGMNHLQTHISQAEWMNYHAGAGSRADREAAASWFEPVLGAVGTDRVIICPGAQSALSAILLAKTGPGDTVACDSLTYPGFLGACRVLQRKVMAVSSDHEGMDPDDLARACEVAAPALIYLVPTIHNPTAVTMSAKRREEIYAVASRYDVPIIEDDPYWLLAGDAAPPLAALSRPGQGAPVYYISTLSKCLTPGLRVAYLVMPAEASIEPVLDALRSITLMTNQSMVSMASYWIRTGMAGEMLGKVRQELMQRQKLAAEVLPGMQAHPHGLHIWLTLPPKLNQYRLIQTALEQGLGVANSDAFSVNESAPAAIRVSLGGAPDKGHLKRALEKLRDILEADQAGQNRTLVV